MRTAASFGVGFVFGALSSFVDLTTGIHPFHLASAVVSGVILGALFAASTVVADLLKIDDERVLTIAVFASSILFIAVMLIRNYLALSR